MVTEVWTLNILREESEIIHRVKKEEKMRISGGNKEMGTEQAKK